jgi:hypothetical protein
LSIAAALSAAHLLHDGVKGPLDPELTWSLRELGATEALVPPLETPVAPLGQALVLTVVAASLFALALVPLGRRRPSGGASSLAWGALGYFFLAAVLWFYYDRYLLPLVVIVAALRLGVVGILRPRLALAGIVVFATISGVGTWDHLQYSGALWDAVDWTRRAGITKRELDGGYIVNGWSQYAHPEHAGRGPNGDVQVPWVNGGEFPRYRIGNDIPAGSRVLHVVPYRRLIAPSGNLYVVDRTPAPS